MNAPKAVVLFCLILISKGSVLSQNKKNANGLKYGHWKYDYPKYDFIEEGSYKIVSFSQFDTVSSNIPEYRNGYGYLEIKYKKKTPTVYVHGVSGDSLTIYEGIWNSYDTRTRKLVESKFWRNGFHEWTKKYDLNGVLTNFDYVDYDNDSSIYLTYINGHVFKKSFYPPKDGNNSVTQYYPFESLSISNAEPEFEINFISKPRDHQYITITAHKDVEISGITADKNISIVRQNNQHLQLPIKLKRDENLSFFIEYAPTPVTYSGHDTVTIKTANDDFSYEIICQGSCAHIDRKNVATIKSVSLSKTKDKYLFIKGCASETDIEIKGPLGLKKSYIIGGQPILEIRLEDFSPGNYSLSVSMGDCEVAGVANLKILE